MKKFEKKIVWNEKTNVGPLLVIGGKIDSRISGDWGVYDEYEEVRYRFDLSDEDEIEDMIGGMLIDMVDRVLISEFGEKLFSNLKELGYKYDGEGWDIKDKMGNYVTCYGFIWDYWYDLDTCVRESVSCIFEEFCEE